ncbi:MAG: amino acid--tRNA ligase-related protein [Nanoarchaeota archaeon]
MIGPYKTESNRTISYKGNNLFPPMKDITDLNHKKNINEEMEGRVRQLGKEKMWGHLARINHRINIVSNAYFDSIGALFTALPLTTRMISSPGAVYGKEALKYTSDTSPITLKWFDLKEQAFLSESSQIYLEIALIQEKVNHVYSIYNSFRKERADATHLSEFHHIEYEGKISQSENEKIALGLLGSIIKDLLSFNKEDLSYFLNEEMLHLLRKISLEIQSIPRISLKESLERLYQDTRDSKYKEFTLKNFGVWEEVRLTELMGGPVIVKEFPLLEVPFYHSQLTEKDALVANNADLIWGGYREILGSGERISSVSELENKSKLFNLPKEDYLPYLETRELPNYVRTSGFGLGWERFIQGILNMPFIWSAAQFPRIDSILKP